MAINDVIMYVMAIGALIGGADCILRNKFGLGEKFEEGFMSLGPTALSMAGIICLSPKLAEWLGPIIIPLYRLMGADPAMFGSILAIDMGGYQLAGALANDIQVGYFSGILVASMLGATVVFTIPVGFSMVREEDWGYFAKGLLIGIVPLPVGAFVGGLLMGLPAWVIFINLLPVIFIGLLLILGLVLAQDSMVIGLIYFGQGIRVITMIGLTAAAFEHMTGIVLISGMPPLMDSMKTVSGICIVLLGSLPLMTLLLRLFKKPLQAAGAQTGLDGSSIAGLLFSCISALPVFRIMKEMNPRGKVIVTAFMVNGMAVFAAHLAFTVEAVPDLLIPMMAAKLTGGILAILLALVFTKTRQLH